MSNNIEERILKLESELKNMEPPPDSELIELGKELHPYYIKHDELNWLKEISNNGD